MNVEINKELLPYKEWLAGIGSSADTIRKYLKSAEKFLSFSGKNLSRITRQDVLAYKDNLMKNCEPLTVNGTMSSLNKLFRFLDNDSLKVEALKTQPKPMINTALTGKEYASLLESALSLGKTRLYFFFRVLGSSGIRYSELLYITPRMLKNGHTSVPLRKKKHEIFIPTALCEELKRYCADRGLTDDDVIFHPRPPDERKDALVNRSCVSRQMQGLALLAGVPKEKICANNFRKMFARNYLTRFENGYDLADLLGYSLSEAPQNYTRASIKEKKARIDELYLSECLDAEKKKL